MECDAALACSSTPAASAMSKRTVCSPEAMAAQVGAHSLRARRGAAAAAAAAGKLAAVL